VTWWPASINCRRFRQGVKSLFRRLLLIALLLETGLLLVLVPWSTFWERNYFGDLVPLVQMVITNNYVRGAISGLGFVNIAFALSEVAAVVAGRSAERHTFTEPDA
jgi:hypothetical protein